METIKIRSAIATDLSRLMALDHSVMSDYVWQLGLQRVEEEITATFREVRLPRPVRVQYPRDVSTLVDDWNRQSALFVALASEPVGYIRLLGQPAAATVWITDLVVSSPHRRQGIARQLCQYGLQWSKERGYRRVMQEMSSKNHPAIQQAQSMGFEFCGYNDKYYATQDVTLFFGRVLR